MSASAWSPPNLTKEHDRVPASRSLCRAIRHLRRRGGSRPAVACVRNGRARSQTLDAAPCAARRSQRACSLRRLLFRLALLDGRPLRGLDRRRLCAGRQHDDRAEDFRLYRRGAGRRQRAGQGRSGPGDASTIATIAWRSSRPRPMSTRPRPRIASKQASLGAQQSAIDAARATVEVDQANLTFAEQEDKRYAALATTGYGSVQNAQQAASRIAAAASDAGARRRGARERDQAAARRAEGRARPSRGGAGARATRSSVRRSSISPTRRSSRRSTAWSAPHPARRPICAGGHATDGGGADAAPSTSSPITRRRS